MDFLAVRNMPYTFESLPLRSLTDNFVDDRPNFLSSIQLEIKIRSRLRVDRRSIQSRGLIAPSFYRIYRSSGQDRRTRNGFRVVHFAFAANAKLHLDGAR